MGLDSSILLALVLAASAQSSYGTEVYILNGSAWFVGKKK